MPNTNPAAAPVDYPPAVLKEAKEACERATQAAANTGSVPRTEADANEKIDRADHAGAQAYADVLARHTVAVRMAAAEQAATDREQSAQAAREASAIATGIDVDDLRIYDPEPSPEIARLTAERDRALGQLETARMQASAVMTGAEAQTATIERMIAERLTLTAERDALAKRVEALRTVLDDLREGMVGRRDQQVRREYIEGALAIDDKAAQS